LKKQVSSNRESGDKSLFQTSIVMMVLGLSDLAQRTKRGDRFLSLMATGAFYSRRRFL
jgi:hypothetical protein